MDFNIKDYLNKFKIILKEKDDFYDSIIEIINNVINIKINKNNIKIKNNFIFIKSSPIIKSEIFINKDKILSLLKEKNINIIDIN